MSEVRVYIAALECSKCDTEMGCVMYENEAHIRQFGKQYGALLCKTCYEDMQQRAVDAQLKWSRLT